jgi:hypothetical protein
MVLVGQISFAQTGGSPQEQLLTSYYGIKNALIDGNSSGAATSAEIFVKIANSTDYKVVSEGNINILVKDAGALSAAKDLKSQREIFANLSRNMTEVAKTVKLSGEPVYKQYCPMKKAFWLSNEKTIKNPYFGNSMLTCGSVEGTIQ